MKNVNQFVFYIIISALLQNCAAQKSEFAYRAVPQKYQPPDSVLTPYILEMKKDMEGAYDLTKCLPINYSTNDSFDYTTCMQQAIDTHRKVIFPDFPVVVNENGLSLRSNSVVIFQEKSHLEIAPNSKALYHILGIVAKHNITIYFPVITGDRLKHKSNKGEWGMGILIGGSSDITIINPKIDNCWGDGIYIGGGKTNHNINIYYPALDNNRRNGISIISGSDINIYSPLISNTNGTDPQCGIDIEPNNNSDTINNVVINKPITYNNEKYGISVGLNKIVGTVEKDINITIQDPVDSSLLSNILISGPKQFINGAIIVTNPVSLNNILKPQQFYFSGHFPKVYIRKD